VALTPDCCQALPLRMMLVHRGAECCMGIVMLDWWCRAAAGESRQLSFHLFICSFVVTGTV
jgi:hypothetical protein